MNLNKGRYALQVANCNHRSRRADLCLLVQEVERFGEELMQALHTG